eukprot:15445565-Alexandrium_andersonii.AAC.1
MATSVQNGARSAGCAGAEHMEQAEKAAPLAGASGSGAGKMRADAPVFAMPATEHAPSALCEPAEHAPNA